MNIALIIHEEGRLDDFKRCLDIHAVHTVEATPFEDPLELCVLHAPHVVVLEARPPYSDVLELCRRLRQHPVAESTAILLVAADMPEAERVAALELGANDCISAEMSPREFPGARQSAPSTAQERCRQAAMRAPRIGFGPRRGASERSGCFLDTHGGPAVRNSDAARRRGVQLRPTGGGHVGTGAPGHDVQHQNSCGAPS